MNPVFGMARASTAAAMARADRLSERDGRLVRAIVSARRGDAQARERALEQARVQPHRQPLHREGIAGQVLGRRSLPHAPGAGAGLCCAMFFGAVLVPEGVMDEHEAGIRDRAHRQSYVFASYLLFPAALIAAAIGAERDGVQVLWAFVAACLLFWGVPYSIIAWSVPDEATSSATATRGAVAPAP